jgi:hypothetical protein
MSAFWVSIGGKEKRPMVAETIIDKPFAEAVKHAVQHLLSGGKTVDHHVLLGPIVWEPRNSARRWYFIVITGNRKRARYDKLGAETSDLCEQFRAALSLALVNRSRKPLVILDLDDELSLARAAEVLWPSDETSKIQRHVEAEGVCGGTVH